MRSGSWHRLVLSLVIAGVGLTFFFGGDLHALGLPLGFVGVWIFVVGVWFFVDAVHSLPQTEDELAIAPGEWQSWVGIAFVTAILIAYLRKSHVFAAPVPIFENPEAGLAGRSIGTLLIAWLILAQALKYRWRGAVTADERDKVIEQIASNWARAATAVFIVGIAILLSFSPTARLQEFSYPFIGHLLIFGLLWGAWFDNAVAATLYWRDRRLAAR